MALTRVREASLLQLANMLSDRSVASTFENFSIGLIEKTLSVFSWPRNGCASFFSECAVPLPGDALVR